MEAKVITLEENIDKLVKDINQATWDEGNEISEYSVQALKAYLERQDTIFVACYETVSQQKILLGIASSRIEFKPYGNKPWLYVDEVDVRSDQRQRGAGKLMMQKLFDLATEKGCEELWLATEFDNTPANKLYRSLKPDDESKVIGFTYEVNA